MNVNNNQLANLIFAILVAVSVASQATQAAPMAPLTYDLDKIQNVDDLVQMLRNYNLQNSKRGLDFGVDRGHSGRLAAKHFMGLAMAGPMGPGRKRRSDYYPENIGFNDIKRGLDMGFGRGYSASEAAKHLMGLEEANDALGPGRKRRDLEEENRGQEGGNE